MLNEPAVAAVQPVATESSSWTYDIAYRILSKSRQALGETLGWGRAAKGTASVFETVGVVTGVVEEKPIAHAVSHVAGKVAGVGAYVGLLGEEKAKLLATDIEKFVTGKIDVSNTDIRCFALDLAGNFVFDMLMPEEAAEWWTTKRDELSSYLADVIVDGGSALVNAGASVASFIGSYLPDHLKNSKLAACTSYLYGDFRDAVGWLSRNAAGQYAVKGVNILLGTVAFNVVLSCLVDVGAAVTPQYVLAAMLAVKVASFASEVVKKSAKKIEVLQVKSYLERIIGLDPKIVAELGQTFDDPSKLHDFIHEHLSAEIERWGGKRVIDQKEIEAFIEELVKHGFAAEDKLSTSSAKSIDDPDVVADIEKDLSSAISSAR